MTDKYLEIQGLGKNFGGLAALKNVTFSVAKNEIVGLIGPNGAGKTTAFNLISGTFPSTAGKVLFNSIDITNRATSRIVVTGLARTFQSTSTYSAVSVRENVYRGLLSRIKGAVVGKLVGRTDNLIDESQVDAEIERILSIVDMHQWRDIPADSLAYGLQKKLGIAIALASRPTMLMLDEPAAGLNHEECNEMKKLLLKLQQDFDMTILLVEHHMAIVMDLCHRIVVLVQGEKIAEGTPAEISSNPLVIEAYLGAPEYAHA